MVSVVIPTYNASFFLPNLLELLRNQTLPLEIIIIDSESTDNTIDLANRQGIIFLSVKKPDFNHGTTRNIGLKMAKFDTVIFLTQDALPVSIYSLENLVSMLNSRDDIVMAYGRQIPHPDAKIFGKLARITNYPPVSLIKTKELIPKMGIKTCSCSNSFAAYKKSALISIGGFPSHTILGEDVSVAARFILLGKAVAYSAEAEVYHSHDYTLLEEFRRYFDIGVFHHQQRLLLAEFTKAESEGIKYAISEIQYLLHLRLYKLIPVQLIRTLSKYTGYKLGLWENFLPVILKRNFSMHRYFWN